MDLVLLRNIISSQSENILVVSILILMDLVLLHKVASVIRVKKLESFNPYFNGSSTSTMFYYSFLLPPKYVSILILMDLVLLLLVILI